MMFKVLKSKNTEKSMSTLLGYGCECCDYESRSEDCEENNEESGKGHSLLVLFIKLLTQYIYLCYENNKSNLISLLDFKDMKVKNLQTILNERLEGAISDSLHKLVKNEDDVKKFLILQRKLFPTMCFSNIRVCTDDDYGSIKGNTEDTMNIIKASKILEEFGIDIEISSRFLLEAIADNEEFYRKHVSNFSCFTELLIIDKNVKVMDVYYVTKVQTLNDFILLLQLRKLMISSEDAKKLHEEISELDIYTKLDAFMTTLADGVEAITKKTHSFNSDSDDFNYDHVTLIDDNTVDGWRLQQLFQIIANHKEIHGYFLDNVPAFERIVCHQFSSLISLFFESPIFDRLILLMYKRDDFEDVIRGIVKSRGGRKKRVSLEELTKLLEKRSSARP